jgi:hypothetical protein
MNRCRSCRVNAALAEKRRNRGRQHISTSAHQSAGTKQPLLEEHPYLCSLPSHRELLSHPCFTYSGHPPQTRAPQQGSLNLDQKERASHSCPKLGARCLRYTYQDMVRKKLPESRHTELICDPKSAVKRAYS